MTLLPAILLRVHLLLPLGTTYTALTWQRHVDTCQVTCHLDTDDVRVQMDIIIKHL